MTSGCGSRLSDVDVDALMASDLNALSLEERNNVFEEIHGVAESVEETPEVIQNGLRGLDEALLAVRGQSPAYNELLEALPTSSLDYLASRKYRLMFLRTELFDTDAAAERMMKYALIKKDCFGTESLGRPLLLSDLDKASMDALKAGTFQFLPVRDRAGRLVLVMRFQDGDEKSQFKALFYMLSAAPSVDEDTQRTGMVAVSYYVGTTNFSDFFVKSFLCELRKLIASVPLRRVSGHFCHSSADMRAIFSIAMMMAPPAVRTRMRLHHGPHTECQYKLMTFGIPVDRFPLSYDLQVKTRAHHKWISRQRVWDNMVSNGSYKTWEGANVPGMKDILVGTGASIPTHAGNRWLVSVMESYLDEYNGARSAGRHKIQTVKTVIIGVESEGARFLKQVDGIWCRVVKQDEKEEKLIHVYRGLNKSRKEEKEKTPDMVASTVVSGSMEGKRLRMVGM